MPHGRVVMLTFVDKSATMRVSHYEKENNMSVRDALDDLQDWMDSLQPEEIEELMSEIGDDSDVLSGVETGVEERSKNQAVPFFVVPTYCCSMSLH